MRQAGSSQTPWKLYERHTSVQHVMLLTSPENLDLRCCSLQLCPARPPGFLLRQFKSFEQSFTLWPDSLFAPLACSVTLDKNRKMVFPFPLLY